MNISNIIYYSRRNDKSQTLSLRDLCLKEEYDKGLETLFYTVRDSADVPELLSGFKKICHEQIEFECEEPSYIRFTVVDAYDNINYLKFKKAKITLGTAPNDLRMGGVKHGFKSCISCQNPF